MLVITVHGGLVESVCTSDPELAQAIGKALILDYDIEGADEEDLVTVRYTTNPVTSKATVNVLTPEPTEVDIKNLTDQIFCE